MKYEIGDTVLLIHSGEEGTITEILSEELVMVNVQGVIFPTYTDQLDFPYFKRFTEQRKAFSAPRRKPGEELPREKKQEVLRTENGVWLSFLPLYGHEEEESQVNALKIHLVNDTSWTYRFHYRFFLGSNMELDIQNESLPFSHFYLQDIPFDHLNEYPRFLIAFSPLKAGSTSFPKGMVESYECTLKLKPKQVIAKLNLLGENQEATFRYPLFAHYPTQDEVDHASWDVEGMVPSIPYVSLDKSDMHYTPVYELDLHIEKLVGDWKGLSPFEMLSIQLNELQRQLDLAIAHRQFSLVVIHGVGKGKLRDEVHEILKQTQEVSSFINQYHIRYGYGATEVFFAYA